MLTTLLLGVQRNQFDALVIFATIARCVNTMYKRTDLHIRFGLILFLFLGTFSVLFGTSSICRLKNNVYSLSYMITLLPWAESFHSMQIFTRRTARQVIFGDRASIAHLLRIHTRHAAINAELSRTFNIFIILYNIRLQEFRKEQKAKKKQNCDAHCINEGRAARWS